MDPNNPIMKVFFVLGFWYLIVYPCYHTFMEIKVSFKGAKLIGKGFKILGMSFFSFMILFMTVFCVERLLHFSTWQIGGKN